MGGEGIESPTKFSKKGGLTDLNFERGVARKEGVIFLRRGRGSDGLQFLQKSKLRSEIFNDKKKFINKNIFFCHN